MEKVNITNLTLEEIQQLINLLYLSADEFWASEGIDGFTGEQRTKCNELLEKCGIDVEY